MIDLKIKRGVWVLFIALFSWGILDLFMRYTFEYDVVYLGSAFFSSFLLSLLIICLRPD